MRKRHSPAMNLHAVAQKASVSASTVSREQIGHIIFDNILGNGRAEPSREIVIDPELVVRDSTGVAAKS